MGQLEVADNTVTADTERASSAYVPPLQKGSRRPSRRTAVVRPGGRCGNRPTAQSQERTVGGESGAAGRPPVCDRSATDAGPAGEQRKVR
jgi:hypothetical protein